LLTANVLKMFRSLRNVLSLKIVNNPPENLSRIYKHNASNTSAALSLLTKRSKYLAQTNSFALPVRRLCNREADKNDTKPTTSAPSSMKYSVADDYIPLKDEQNIIQDIFDEEWEPLEAPVYQKEEIPEWIRKREFI